MLLTLTVLALAPSFSLSHYTFPQMITSSNVSSEWQYVRMTANHYSSAPIENPSLPAMRCYEDAAGAVAGVATIRAGDTLGFKASNTMGHPGPVLWYMAKSPAGKDVASFKAEGNVWFKIKETGAKTDATGVHFETGMNVVKATIPKTLPEGSYLVRVEHIALHKMGQPQFYVACGQVKVTGGGHGSPGPMVAFPGAYKASDAGIKYNLYGSPVIPYPIPGPAVWSG